MLTDCLFRALHVGIEATIGEGHAPGSLLPFVGESRCAIQHAQTALPMRLFFISSAAGLEKDAD